jgi:hypothetical protein
VSAESGGCQGPYRHRGSHQGLWCHSVWLIGCPQHKTEVCLRCYQPFWGCAVLRTVLKHSAVLQPDAFAADGTHSKIAAACGRMRLGWCRCMSAQSVCLQASVCGGVLSTTCAVHSLRMHAPVRSSLPLSVAGSAEQCCHVMHAGVLAGPHCAVLCCAVLCCAVLCCAVLCCAVLCCAVLCCAVLCCAVLSCAVLCCAVLCCAVLCCAVLCCAVLCCALQVSCVWHDAHLLTTPGSLLPPPLPCASF